MMVNFLKGLVLAFVITFNCNLKAQQALKADDANRAKAKEWIGSLELNNAEKENRLVEVVAVHLSAVRDWHNSHPASTVPSGINPLDGKPLSDLHKQIIADSAMPTSVHQDLMEGLRKDLDEVQVARVLDKYTVGKVDFTMIGYKAIVPDLNEEEEKEIRKLLEKAREQAVDFKSMKEISAIFEIYKTQAEQYLNNHGRNWRQLYSDYVKKVKAEKAAKKQ